MTEFESNSGVHGRKGHQHKNALIKCFEMSLNLLHLRVNFKNPCTVPTILYGRVTFLEFQCPPSLVYR